MRTTVNVNTAALPLLRSHRRPIPIATLLERVEVSVERYLQQDTDKQVLSWSDIKHYSEWVKCIREFATIGL